VKSVDTDKARIVNGEWRTARAERIIAIRFSLFVSLRGSAMVRKIVITLILSAAAVVLGGNAAAWAIGGEFAGPGPAVTGNDTGGIFPYSPNVEPIYRQIAGDYCARWGRFAKVTSVHRVYGDYIGFVCFDRPGKIH
jgi:hypothetical protein